MVFSSLTFLLCYLPAVLAVYYLAPQKLKNSVLFVFSLLFYAWGEPIYVGLMLFSTALDYCCGRAVEKYRGTPKAKAALICSITINLGLLCLFKYTDFVLATLNGLFGLSVPLIKLPLPIGISFYTFQTMSYTIDVYRGNIKAQKNVVSFGAYVSLFPQLIAGPIVRYQTIAEQIDCRKSTAALFASGIRRFVRGLGKKVLLANNIGLLWNTISQTDAAKLTVLSAWLGVTAFAFQIYFDFSGYSDMAIGLGRMFGFEFCENFDYPYISASVTEFWRRWHISMGTWFRDYVYIPLGGNRRGLKIQLRNIALVWILTGFWHGAAWNYVLWGVFYGSLLMIEKFGWLGKLKKLPTFVGRIYTLFCVLVGWALFAIEDFSKLGGYFKAMFGVRTGLCDSNAMWQLASYLPLLAVCALASTPFLSKLYAGLNRKCAPAVATCADAFGIAGAALLSTAYLISGSYNPFLYFRF